MWIMSQDKTKLVGVNQVVVEGSKIICNKWVLGEYVSNKRAIEVLRDINAHINLNRTHAFEMPME